MSKQTKNILLILAIAFAAYVVYAIYSAFKAGEKTLLGLLTAPFSAVSGVWAAVTSLFSSTSVPTLNRPTGTTVGDQTVNAWLDSTAPVPVSNSPTIATIFNTP